MRFLIRTFKAKPIITSFFSVGSGKLSYSGQKKTITCTAVHELVKNCCAPPWWRRAARHLGRESTLSLFSISQASLGIQAEVGLVQ
jgi:hypothetical protein